MRLGAAFGTTALLTGATVAAVPDRPTWPGPSFREFSGAFQARVDKPLWDHCLSWDRVDLSWSKCEPERGQWRQEALDGFGKRVLAARGRNAHVLPTLDYSAPWSWDKGERAFEYEDTRRRFVPRGDGRFEVHEQRRDVGGRWVDGERKTATGKGTWPLAAEHVPDWEATGWRRLLTDGLTTDEVGRGVRLRVLLFDRTDLSGDSWGFSGSVHTFYVVFFRQ